MWLKGPWAYVFVQKLLVLLNSDKCLYAAAAPGQSYPNISTKETIIVMFKLFHLAKLKTLLVNHVHRTAVAMPACIATRHTVMKNKKRLLWHTSI